MGRVANENKFIYFNASGYIHALQMSLKEATKEIRDLLYDYIIDNLQKITFKDNKVRLTGGKVTSDSARKAAVLKSIRKEVIKYVKYSRDTIIISAVKALADNFKDSHIGIYYEYGTGLKAEDVKLPVAGDLNRYRTGKEIVSRSKHIDYSGLGKGVWRDMGGNIRVTGSPEAGRRDQGFKKYIGDDIEAYHWFRNAVRKTRQEIIRIYNRAIAKVNPLDYLNIKSSFTLGKDRG